MLSPWHIAVVIPARNEEDLLPRCLASVEVACAAVQRYATTDIVLAVDSSDDMTEAIARAALKSSGFVLRVKAGCVGLARSAAAEQALRRFAGSLNQCWLANTDADCNVPESWLCDQLKAAQAGYDAVAGIVDVDTFAEHDEQVAELFRLTYLLHPDGTHPHVHGANLGVRADAYLRAGGFGSLATAEDHDLWKRLQETGSRKRISDSRLKVITSGRRLGRAPRGFADALAAHNAVTA